MSIESQRLLIGACGWQHPAWELEFYPADIPPEWQITYYANEFPVVLLRASDWNLQTDLKQLRADVHEAFRFVVELPAAILSDRSQLADWLNHVQLLGEQCLALIYSITPQLSEDLDYLQQILDAGKQLAPLAIDVPGRVLSAQLLDWLAQQQVSMVWHTDTPSHWQGAPLAITRISEVGDAKQLRRIVENCLSASRQQQVAILLFDGTPPSLEDMRNAGIIVDLL